MRASFWDPVRPGVVPRRIQSLHPPSKRSCTRRAKPAQREIFIAWLEELFELCKQTLIAARQKRGAVPPGLKMNYDIM